MSRGRDYLTRAELVAEIERRFASMSAKEEAGGIERGQPGEGAQVVSEEREAEAGSFRSSRQPRADGSAKKHLPKIPVDFDNPTV
jgi:hypothetical protein